VVETFSCRSRGIQNRPTPAPEAWQKVADHEIVVGLMKETQSASGLAHSTTLRAVWSSSNNAPASWTAAALRRFSAAQQLTP